MTCERSYFHVSCYAMFISICQCVLMCVLICTARFLAIFTHAEKLKNSGDVGWQLPSTNSV